MKASSLAFLSVLLVVTCSFQVCLAQNSTNITDRQCVDNGVEPDHELSDFDSYFYAFAQKLELYTGLSGTENFSVTLDLCGGTVCKVNPNGMAIWEARMDLYHNNMMDLELDEADNLHTLDGCLCFSQNVVDYQNCMINVRQSMIGQLDSVLVVKFKNILEKDCSSLSDNCIDIA